jgi:very-short-patch-repair endonuclease
VCFIADFYLPKPFKTVIEIDGKYHQHRVEKDTGRDLFFKHERNIRTLRFTNEFVMSKTIEELSCLLTTLLTNDS